MYKYIPFNSFFRIHDCVYNFELVPFLSVSLVPSVCIELDLNVMCSIWNSDEKCNILINDLDKFMVYIIWNVPQNKCGAKNWDRKEVRVFCMALKKFHWNRCQADRLDNLFYRIQPNWCSKCFETTLEIRKMQWIAQVFCILFMFHFKNECFRAARTNFMRSDDKI